MDAAHTDSQTKTVYKLYLLSRFFSGAVYDYAYPMILIHSHLVAPARAAHLATRCAPLMLISTGQPHTELCKRNIMNHVG